ncbi:MAG: ATP synthase F1 subunit delta [Bacteroidota bacterium]
MKGTKSASRYAKALLELAIEFKQVDAISNDMKFLLQTNENKDFGVFLNSPVINTDKKISILNEIFGQFEELTTKFINLVTKNRREALLPTIAESYDEQMKAYKGIVPVTITSAVSLNDTTKNEIIGKIGSSVSGKEIELTEVIDADIIGGFIVRMGDTQIDASVASQFGKLKQRLTR